MLSFFTRVLNHKPTFKSTPPSIHPCHKWSLKKCNQITCLTPEHKMFLLDHLQHLNFFIVSLNWLFLNCNEWWSFRLLDASIQSNIIVNNKSSYSYSKCFYVGFSYPFVLSHFHIHLFLPTFQTSNAQSNSSTEQK